MAISTNLHVIAAICGNFWQESTVNPGIWENLTVGAPGFGLGQWTDNPPIVERRTALFNWLDANGYARDSGDGQLAFLVHEDIWIPTSFQQSDYNTLTEFFQSTDTSTAKLVEEWMFHWEGINDGSYNNRLDFALSVYNYLTSGVTERQPWYSSNSYLSTDQAKWNSLRIMDFFLGEEPPEPPVPPVPPYHRKRKGLPPWLIYKLS